ncbi:MAG: hypothetical protein K8E66_05455 [Phycisphaerales bacterium]|nr:hypothetical protein [Phycisphaerales bacterium]
MRPLTLIACLYIAGVAPLSLAQHAGHGAESHQSTADPVNAMCPIGKEPVVPSAGTVEHKGKAIGLCCPGCGKQFLAWDEARKDEFVALAVSHREPGMGDHAVHDADPAASPSTDAADENEWTFPYTLDTCPVSGQKLGSMGDPIVKKYEGREVRFCCGSCIGKFEADQPGYWKKIDEQIVKDQMHYFTAETCVVSGEPLIEDGDDIATNLVYGNRLVRLCCKMCTKDFKADPKKFIAKLDKMTADAQRKNYPLESCPVSGGELGSMGEPAELVLAGRLVRLCCANCEPKIRANPAKYLDAIDKTWQAQGMYMPMDHDAGHDADHGDQHDDDGHGDHDHD